MNDLEQKVYEAFLKAAIELGPKIKELSWFGRNNCLTLPKD